MMSGSSTPIRISTNAVASGSDSPILGTIPGALGTGNAAQQSSSVPTITGGHMHLHSPVPLAMGSSNQSLGVGPGGGGGSISGVSITPPNSAGLRQTGGGLANWATDFRDGNHTDKTQSDASKLNRKESYKAQRKTYRREKKRVASELMNSLQDPAVIVLADWLKIRGTLKSWTKLWCVLKPGLLLIYKSPKTKSSHWVGTVMLTSCQVIERPSKKDGFCFKLFHPMEQSIWAPRGPEKETLGAVVQPLPTAYLIFRAPSQAAGKCWMDALELSLRCSALLLRSNSSTGGAQGNYTPDASQISHETQWSEADYEKHFNDQDLDADSPNEAVAAGISGADTDSESDVPDAKKRIENERDPIETTYVPMPEEEFGEQGEQVEELGEENKSLIWLLVKQVRPGMDLSKVVLPTFILEPRSFLDKLGDSYYHADMLSKAVLEDDPFTRMKCVVQWYLSGFYKKPKGLKKPYNPILGEVYRCYWLHPNGSRTYYIAEQVSHHPPISSFYVTNRQDGFCISCTILAKSKFYGNSTSAVLEGEATLTLLPRGESYTLTTPYAHCKGILMGKLSMELAGDITIACENTGYMTELEFKLKPFLGGSDATNVISGKIKLGKNTMATISGRWDSEMNIRDVKSGEETLLLKVDRETIKSRLMRYVVPLEEQMQTESTLLWNDVTEAIKSDDQNAATAAKTILEENQRSGAKARQSAMVEWEAKYFTLDTLTGQWIYNYADMRPWDPRVDIKQFESDFQVLTLTRQNKTPINIRIPSIIATEPLHKLRKESLLPAIRGSQNAEKRRSAKKGRVYNSDSSRSPDDTIKNSEFANATQGSRKRNQTKLYSDSSQSGEEIKPSISNKTIRQLMVAIEDVNNMLDNHTRQLNDIKNRLERIQYAPALAHNVNSASSSDSMFGRSIPRSMPLSTVLSSVVYAFIALFVCIFIKWLTK